MATTKAPERRRAADGTWEVFVRDRWLSAEDPGTMAAWTEWQDGIERAARMLGRKAAPYTTAAVPLTPVALDGLDRRLGARGGPTVCLDGQWIAVAAVEAWNAFLEHRSMAAAADALGVVPDLVRKRVERYEQVFGVTRPPAIDTTPDPKPPSSPPSTRFDSGSKRKPWDPPKPADQPSGTAESKRQAKRRVTRPGHAPDPASPEHLADDAHIVGTERRGRGGDGPARAREVMDDAQRQLEARIRARLEEPSGPDEAARARQAPTLSEAGADHASDIHPAVSSAVLELVDEGEVHRARRTGYASGYAVATLRAIACLTELPEQLRDMASDAADGLMA